jgi:glycosyltransferase involved in cell wall biosynthesis
VTADDDAEALRHLAPAAPISILPNGVDLDYFRPVDEPKEPSTIVISGKMSYHANITAVLDFVHAAWPLVRQHHPGVRLRIVGSGPPESIRALARDPDVEVTGYLDDVRPAIRRATVAVCPVTVKVGIQNKILEAMALGVPVVSTQAGAVGLQAVPGQDLLVGQDAAQVASLIRELLVDPRRRAEVAAAGRRYVEAHHRWDVVSSRLERAYDETLARVRGAAARR